MYEEGGRERNGKCQKSRDDEGRAPCGDGQDVPGQYRHGQAAEVVPHHREAHGAALRLGEPQPDEPSRREHVHPGEREELKEAQSVEVPQLGHHGSKHQTHAEEGQSTGQERPRSVVVHEPSEERRGQTADGPERQRGRDLGATPPERLLQGLDVQPEGVVCRADGEGRRQENDPDDQEAIVLPAAGAKHHVGSAIRKHPDYGTRATAVRLEELAMKTTADRPLAGAIRESPLRPLFVSGCHPT